MELNELTALFARMPQVEQLAKAMGDRHITSMALEGLSASAAPMVFAALMERRPQRMLFILNDTEEAGYFYHDLTQVLGEERVLFFPSSYRRAVKYGQRDAASEILRTEVLSRVSAQHGEGGGPLYIVSCPEAVAELVVSRRRLDSRTLILRQGETADLDALCKQMRTLGFQEVDYVYEPGQFALRGSILDVYSYSSELPFRLDFFGDDIDSIRTFEVDTQLSADRREQVEIVPEVTATADDRVPLLAFLPQDTVIAARDMHYVGEAVERTYREGFSAQAIAERTEGMTEMERERTVSEMRKEVRLTTGSEFREAAAAFRLVEFGHRPSRQPQLTVPFHTAPQPLFHKNFDLLRQTLEDYQLRGYRVFILADSDKQNERLREILGGSSLEERGERREEREYFQGLGFESEKNRGKQQSKSLSSLLSPLSSQAEGKHQSKSLSALLSPLSSQAEGKQQNISLLPPSFPLSPKIIFIHKTLHEGFADDTLRVCLFTDHQIFDRYHKYSLRSDKARGGKVALTLKELQEFEVGDYVVHVDHGVGRFGGLVRMPQGDGFQELIKITFQRGDSIYVSIHALNKVSKYRSQESGEPPRLSTLGTGQWERLKERTKNKIKDIARDLIRLYAQRRKERGFAFSADSYLQQELEASFLYEDTPDQLKATNDVKADMERPRPMDRLVCGDVGFGKTEVAIRAAFKAACDSKQVAVMVPTTVLAYQHYQTFAKRLKDLPVRVDYLSRARSAKQTKEVLKDLADGKVDILVGTHKLIGKSVKFKDLGLLIIDEEQKFGVATKEKLRQMKTSVDTLTMSATPIPRTLQFSLVGARDMSIIQTPPPNRYPIQTEIHTFSADIIAEAINFEMSRNGQVYFVSNRIASLNELSALIHKYVPDARVAIGHGQMHPEELEKIIMDFANYDYDVLLSTTIVENGIDIPNANTIIINSAQHFGLSDLHQMRGRVGRGNRKAFCYLLAPPLADLPQESRRRLEALENFSGLGSGIHIAMQDLDIRGAGNMLGAEQSGFIADLGYETYQKILTQAVTELKNDEFADLYADEARRGEVSGDQFVDDCTLESDLEMYFPATYVPSDSERMLLYRELDSLSSDDEVARYRSRMLDRFGPLPREAEELLKVVPLRRLGKALGCETLILKKGRMSIVFVSNVNSAYYQSHTFDSVLSFVASHARRCNFKEQGGKRSMIVSDVKTVKEALEVLSEIIK